MFRIVRGGREELTNAVREKAVGIREYSAGFEVLVKAENIRYFPSGAYPKPASIDDIMIFTSKR